MCTCNDLLLALATALCPEDPRSVVIGPVDLGHPNPGPAARQAAEQ